ncbi:MAG TPA: sigma-70 family RNA polymerase sigma factor [Streptosporangiaceae bacterium]|nr:sigma-70 family RNA polymerase sigma factor [Streptosporangiaceae bacterium]
MAMTQLLPVPSCPGTDPFESSDRLELHELTDAELAQLLGDPRHGDDARAALVARYQSLVRNSAHQYQLPAQYYEDLVQVGYLGLMKAINNFDPTVRQELKPYAHSCVTGEIKRFFRDKRWLIRVSRSDQELFLNAKKAQAELSAELGATPTDDQVAARLNVTAEALRHAYQAHDAFAPESLDAPVSTSDDRDSGDLIGSDDSALDRAVDMDAVRLHWDELPIPQQQILLMRFYGNMTQAQVAERLHCSQMHVSRLQSRALALLRKRLMDD